MINFGLSVNVKGPLKMLDGLANGIKNTITQRAVNHAADRVKTEATRKISDGYNITQTKVRQRIKVRKVSFRNGRFEAEVFVPEAGGKYRALHLTDLRGTKDLRNSIGSVGKYNIRLARRDRKGKVTTKGGVEFSIIKGRKQRLPHAFIAPGKNSGKLIAFERENQNDPRSKLKAIYRIDVPQMFNTRRIYTDLIRVANTALKGEIERLLRVELAKAR